jgi:ankyrin repeat protein
MSGADPNKINKEGISAFQSAVKRGNVNIVKDLVELIKRPNGLTKININ